MNTPEHQKNYLSFVVQAEKLDQFMRETEQMEKVLGGKTEDERKKMRDDESSKAMFQMKSVSLKAFNERR